MVLNAAEIPSSSTQSHEMRITDHGRIHCFVSFALKFLQENPKRPLVLHTFPSTKDEPVPKRATNTQQPQTTQPPETQANAKILSSDEPPPKRRKIATAAATIPRLVSVVEIIKREYGKWVTTQRPSGTGAGALRTGLHQYNELATLEELGIVESQEHEPDNTEPLRQALEGKNFLKQKFTPHLKVTLSVHPQPELEAKGATHQPPQPIKISRSARAREQKRQKRKEAARMSRV